MVINIEFDKIRMRSLLAIPTLGVIVVSGIVTDPVTVLGICGMILACVKYDKDAEVEV